MTAITPTTRTDAPRRARRRRTLGVLAGVAGVLGIAGLVLAGGRADAASPFSGQVIGTTLFVYASGGDDVVVLQLAPGDATTLEVDFGADGADLSFDRSTFTSIVVLAQGGADQVRISEVNGMFTDTEATTLDGGGGIDTILGGSGSETLLGQGGNDVLDANRGDDTVFGGGGADTVTWDPGDGSDTVEGQDGNDTLGFHAANIGEIIDVSTNGTRTRLTRNIGNITMDLDGIETIHLDMLGGADIVNVNDLSGTAARTVDVALQASGGGGDAQPDVVTAFGTPIADLIEAEAEGPAAVVKGLPVETRVTGGEPLSDQLVVNGVSGMDSFEGHPATGAVVDVIYDGGADLDAAFTEGTSADETFQVVANGTRAYVSDGGAGFFEVANAESFVIDAKGGADNISAVGNLAAILPFVNFTGGGGNDTILGTNGFDTLVGGGGTDFVDGQQGNDLVYLGGGADTAQWDPGDGNDTIEGEAGKDTLAFHGANISENIDVAANGTRTRLFRDIANITMDLNGVETLDVSTLGGADIVTVNDLTGTTTKTVAVNLEASGGGADAQLDQVVVNGTGAADSLELSGAGPAASVKGLAITPLVTGAETLDEMIVRGGAGDDTLEVLPGPAPVTIVPEGGADDDLVFLDGTTGDDQFQVVANGARANVFDTAGNTFQVVDAETVRLNGKGGNDQFTSTGNLAALLPLLVLDGEGGNDTILGSNGADVLLGGSGNDFVDGQQGNDLVYLGGGTDTAQWDPGDGNDTIEGEAGTDTLAFHGANIAENIDVSANGTRTRLFRNIANITMDLNGVETIDVSTVGGADIVTVGDLTGTSTRTVDVDLAASGGGGDASADQVVVTGTNNVDAITVTGAGDTASVKGLWAAVNVTGGAEYANDRLAIDTLAGADTVTSSGLPPNVIQLWIDGVQAV